MTKSKRPAGRGGEHVLRALRAILCDPCDLLRPPSCDLAGSRVVSTGASFVRR
eukprot:CAMPEP_0183358970 /NCGR_PEP_ID=MMETSP0164_2-20130417/50897_1 /TAXON_ID=221442 /ORGANISM="Coccolithus pelagicus ssp braarudi, Strain PLY182g" /LENGTH=52 /DNA_ID=CAMNT_0025532981 /DNA_START=265 /DNA_END=419 /DNA_ORIENTATION=+